MLTLKEGSNPFEPRAYENAARAISAFDGDIEQLSRPFNWNGYGRIRHSVENGEDMAVARDIGVLTIRGNDDKIVGELIWYHTGYYVRA